MMLLEKQHYLCALCALENPNLVCISSDTESYGLRREIFRKRKVPGLKQVSLGKHPDGWGRQANTNRL